MLLGPPQLGCVATELHGRDRVTLDTAQGLDISGCRQGPRSLLHAARLFHVDYRINKHKSVVCNGLFLNFFWERFSLLAEVTT